ncbi:MAG: heme exporter protein CcmD [Granulosicoccus sp.]
MGGYAFFVWSSYALTALCLIGVVMWSSFKYRTTREQSFKRALQHQARRSK